MALPAVLAAADDELRNPLFGSGALGMLVSTAAELSEDESLPLIERILAGAEQAGVDSLALVRAATSLPAWRRPSAVPLLMRALDLGRVIRPGAINQYLFDLRFSLLAALRRAQDPEAVEALVDLLLELGPDPPAVREALLWKSMRHFVDRDVLSVISQLADASIEYLDQARAWLERWRQTRPAVYRGRGALLYSLQDRLVSLRRLLSGAR